MKAPMEDLKGLSFGLLGIMLALLYLGVGAAYGWR